MKQIFMTGHGHKYRVTWRQFRLFFIAAIVHVMLLSSAQAADSGEFDQTDWAGGVSAANAVHPGNQTGWTVYSAKDDDLAVVSGGTELQLNTLTNAITHSELADFPEPANPFRIHQNRLDFIEGSTTTNTFVSGSRVLLGISAQSPAWTANASWDANDVGSFSHPALADLDGDGDQDLLIGSFNGILGYENTGSSASSVWTANSAWNLPVTGSLNVAPEFADLDGDGDVDLLIGTSTGLTLGYENIGSSTAPSWSPNSDWDVGDIGSLAAPALIDLDGDGDLDLLIGESSGISLAYENTGSSVNPVWTANSAWDAPDVGTNAVPAFADLDSDGDPDLLIGKNDGISLGYENTGSAASPTWEANVAWDIPAVGLRSVPALSDLDGDGDQDVLLGDFGGVSFAYENTGTTTFASSGTYVSSVIDTVSHYGFTTLDYSIDEPTNTSITVDIRAGDTVTPDGSWTAWQTGIVNGGDISVLATNRYVQYRANLSTTDTSVSSALDSITINYVNYPYRLDVSVLGDGGVELDLVSAGVYQSAGTYISSAVDVDEHLGFTTLDYTATVPTNTSITVDIRAGDTLTPGDISWSAWQSNVADGGDISSLPTSRYAQYRINLATTDTSVTPTLSDISINRTRYSSSSVTLTSSAYDSGDATNLIDGLGWTEILPTGTDVRVQLRTAADSGGSPGTWSAWTGPEGSSSYWNSANTFSGGCSSTTTIACALPADLRDSVDDQWFQYRLEILTADPSVTPVVSDIQVSYASILTATGRMTITPTSGLVTAEDGTQASFTVVLDSAPGANVTTDLFSTDLTEGLVSPASLTFTPANWDTPQTVTITGQNDFVDDGDIAYAVNLGATVSADAAFDDINPGSVSVINNDDDTAGISVTPVTGLMTTEAGGTDTFTVVLDSQPLQDVTIGLSSTNTSEGTVSPTSLTFTAANWNVAQTVTVAGVDDLIIDGDMPYSITTVAATSIDTLYSGLDAADVAVINTDNDVPELVFSPATLETSEWGGFAPFTVRLASQPTAAVTFTLTSSDLTEGTVSPLSSTFTFQPSEWDSPKSGTLMGVSDSEPDGDMAYSLVTSAFSSADAVWNGDNPDDIPATNFDDDSYTIVTRSISDEFTNEDGGTVRFTLAPGATPSADVTIPLSTSDSSEAAVSPASVTFPAGDNNGVTVTVTGIDDREFDGNRGYSIIIGAATSADTNYDGMNPDDVSLTNEDNDYTASSVESNVASSFFGSVVITGDIDGDGRLDLVVGAERDNGFTGRVYVYYGTASGYAATADWMAVGGAAIDAFGHSVAVADVNNDGYGDVIVGAYLADNGEANEGRVYAYYGSASGLPDADANGTALVSDANWIAESDQASAQMGISVANAGDINNDTYDDIIVGANFYDNGQANEGRVFVYHGSASGLPDADANGIALVSDANWIAETDQANANLGWSVASAGDVNNDTYDDIIVGANQFSNGQSAEGRAFVYFGSASGLPDADANGIALVTDANWMVESDQANAQLGYSVASAGDVNNDGFDDLIIGAYRYSNGETNEGRVFVYHGSAGGLPDADSNGIAVVSDADWIAESDQNVASFGISVASAGDINGDGFDDVIIGTNAYDSDEGDEGRAYVYHGSASGLPYTDCAELSDNIAHPCEGGWIAEGMAGAQSGGQVGSLGDLNGDGSADLFVSAPESDNGETDEGLVFIYLSEESTPGVTVTPSSGLITTESGGTATFDIVLDAVPTASVSIALSSSDTTEGTISPALLTFTLVDWMIPQTVTVTGVNDDIDEVGGDGDVGYTVVTGDVTSADDGYNILDDVDVTDVSVTNIDNDITQTVSVTAEDVIESGTASFTFARSGEITDDLPVSYSVVVTGAGIATPGTDYITLTGGVIIPAGSASAIVLLQTVNDGIDESDESVIVTVEPGADYTPGTPATATATIIDNDSVGVVIFPSSVLVTSESTGTATFTIRLSSQPADDVTIDFSSSDDTEGVILPESVTFTSANWNVRQTLTVIGQDDDVADNDIDYSIITSNSVSSDASYNGLVIPNISMLNLDNEGVANVSVLASTATVNEASTSPAVFTITRTGSTADELRVFYTMSGSAQPLVDYNSSVSPVTIPAGESSVSINITPIQDAEEESDETVVLSLAAASDYLAASPTSDTVVITDDDNPVAPLANFYVDQVVGEGVTATVNVVLSGTAQTYPVTIPYAVSGTATPATDHDAVSGNIVIASGVSGSVAVDIFADAESESDETIILRMGTPTNARRGNRNSHTIIITDVNVAPIVSLTATQGGLPTRLITTDGGDVTITATVDDPNSGDLHSYDWSDSNGNLLSNEVGGPGAATFVFNPAALSNGNFYAMRLTVTDDGSPAQSTEVDLLLEVNVAPALTAIDSDNDGATDDLESYDDSDGDGIADYLDTSALGSHELQMFAAQGGTYIVRTEAGLTLKLGETALAAGNNGALVSAEDIENFGGGEGQPGASATDTVQNIGGYFDFEISGLKQLGQSVRIVLPQLTPLLQGAVYRKYDAVTGWRDYAVDGNNLLASAPGAPGICPLPGDAAYTTGLTAGHYCVQLTIQDGGSNDMDAPGDANGIANYVIKDPAQLGVTADAAASDNEVVITITDSNSGGGIMNPALLLIWIYLYMVRTRRRSVLTLRLMPGRKY